MIRRNLFRLAELFFLLTLFGCVNSMQLVYEKPVPVPFTKGEISVAVHDEREPMKGGTDPLNVGNLRNTFGAPFTVKAAPDRKPTKVAKELISECLMAAGYNVVDTADKAPMLYAVLKNFWSDGYQYSRTTMHMPMELIKDIKAPAVWSYDLNVDTGATLLKAGYHSVNVDFNKMLNLAKDELLLVFNSDEFEKEYRRALK